MLSQKTLNTFALVICSVATLILPACSTKQNNATQEYASQYTEQYDLVAVDTLVYHHTDSSYIGAVGEMKPWNGNIIVVDARFLKIMVLNQRNDALLLVSQHGNRGNGPGEFITPMTIVPTKDSLYVFDPFAKRITIYDQAMRMIGHQSFSVAIGMDIGKSALCIDTLFYIPSVMLDTSKQQTELNAAYYASARSVSVIKHGGAMVASIFPYEDLYTDPNSKRTAFVDIRKRTNLAYGNQKTFFAQHEGVPLITHFDTQNRIIKRFSYTSKFFKTPPLDDDFKPFTPEKWAQFYGQMSFYDGLEFDPTQNLLLSVLACPTEDAYRKSDPTLYKRYLQVYDKEYNCVFDQQVQGMLEFVQNGNIYLLTENSKDRMVLTVYRLQKKKTA
jgi:hypothetical protein